mmetsp:Transcript_139170/g.444687  ORF Transcript_139170/g.444687 Transcript_139170/m.444687 type:complete len:376 (+) Transcript_139170:842-1969(+)
MALRCRSCLRWSNQAWKQVLFCPRSDELARWPAVFSNCLACMLVSFSRSLAISSRRLISSTSRQAAKAKYLFCESLEAQNFASDFIATSERFASSSSECCRNLFASENSDSQVEKQVLSRPESEDAAKLIKALWVCCKCIAFSRFTSFSIASLRLSWRTWYQSPTATRRTTCSLLLHILRKDCMAASDFKARSRMISSRSFLASLAVMSMEVKMVLSSTSLFDAAMVPMVFSKFLSCADFMFWRCAIAFSLRVSSTISSQVMKHKRSIAEPSEAQTWATADIAACDFLALSSSSERLVDCASRSASSQTAKAPLRRPLSEDCAMQRNAPANCLSFICAIFCFSASMASKIFSCSASFQAFMLNRTDAASLPAVIF